MTMKVTEHPYIDKRTVQTRHVLNYALIMGFFGMAIYIDGNQMSVGIRVRCSRFILALFEKNKNMLTYFWNVFGNLFI